MSEQITAERVYRTITLTNRPPVRIAEDSWPCIAEGIVDDWNGSSGFRHDANRITTIAVRVRQHQDGRAIVYARYKYETRWQDEKSWIERAGELLPTSEDLVAAIRRVGAQLQTQCQDDDRIDCAVRLCVADLPAEQL